MRKLSLGSLKRIFAPARGRGGAAMAVAVCLMAVFMALSMAALLSASVLTGNAERDIYRDRAQAMAVSLLKRVEGDLCAQDAAQNGIQEYLAQNIRLFGRGGIWAYYREELGGSAEAYTRSFDLPLEDMAEDELSAQISVYWAADSAVIEDTSQDLEAQCSSVGLYVTVKCGCGGEEYALRQTYGLNYDKTNRTFTWYAEGVGE